MSPRDIDSFAPQSIAVVQIGKLGDMILTTPLLVALSDLYPGARLTLIASDTAASIASDLNCVDDVIRVARGGIGLFGALVRLRMHAFDLYIDPKDHRSSTARLLAHSARANVVIAHPENGPRHARALSATSSPGHFVDRMLAPLRNLSPGREHQRRPHLDVPSEYNGVAAQLRTQVGNRYAVVNISAGAEPRRMSRDQASRIIKVLVTRIPVAIISSSRDRATAHAIATEAAGIVVVDTGHVLEMVAVVAGAALCVTPDTSVVHAASAFDTPTVGLYPYAPDNLRLFAPLATRRSVVVAQPSQIISQIDEGVVLRAIDDVLDF